MKFEIDAHVRRGDFTLEVAFSCETNALGVVGPSGSGKSTLLEAIAGIVEGARVVLDGEDVSAWRLEQRAMGYVMQDALLFPHLSVRRNVLFSPRAESLGDVPKALGMDGLLERMPRHLSGGERRRVALARAIVSRPRLLLLDEPFTGLDAARRQEAMALLKDVEGRYRLPMIVVSHVPAEVMGICEQTLRLDEGRCVALGPSSGIVA